MRIMKCNADPYGSSSNTTLRACCSMRSRRSWSGFVARIETAILNQKSRNCGREKRGTWVSIESSRLSASSVRPARISASTSGNPAPLVSG
jgi:hypothetical protein